MRSESTKRKIKEIVTRIFIHFILLAASVTVLIPLYYMVVSSFKSIPQFSESQFGLPIPPNLTKVVKIFKVFNFATYFKNSLVIAGFTVFITLFIGSLAAFAFTKMRFKWKWHIFYFIIGSLMVSPLSLLIPLFIQMKHFGLTNRYTGVVLIYTTFNIPLAVYLLTKSFKNIPDSLVEAARIDGCRTFQIYYRIILPLAKPILATLAIVVFLEVWNELLTALVFLQEEQMYTLMVGITSFQGKYLVDVPQMMSGILIATLPLVIFYMFSQKYFIKGLTHGSVKE